MEPQKTLIAKTIFRRKEKGGGIMLPAYNKLNYETTGIKTPQYFYPPSREGQKKSRKSRDKKCL